MFSLLSGLWHYLFSKTEVHILIVGLDHAGKTTLLEQSKGIYKKTSNTIPPERIPPTVGMNIGKMNISECNVIFWDLGGQVRMRSIWDKYYAEAHGVIFVIDSADLGRFEESKLAFDSILEHDELNGIPVLLFANKQDKNGAVSGEDIEANFDPRGFQQNHQIKVQPCSAITLDGIEIGCEWIVNTAKQVARKLDR